MPSLAGVPGRAAAAAAAVRIEDTAAGGIIGGASVLGVWTKRSVFGAALASGDATEAVVRVGVGTVDDATDLGAWLEAVVAAAAAGPLESAVALAPALV